MVDKKPEYKGPSDTVAAFGQSQVDGYVGNAIGAAAGVVAGTTLHNKGKHTALNTAWNSGAQKARTDLRGVIEAEGWGHVFWHSMGRGTKVIAAAAAGAIVLGVVGNFVGFFRGIKKSKAAREQFEQLANENQLLKQKVEITEAAASKSFVASEEVRRSQAETQTVNR